MHMQQQEINLFINHVHFQLDREQNRLYEVGRFRNTISLDAFKDEGNHYTCLFSKETSNIHNGMVKAGEEREDIIPVVIPKEVLEGITENYRAYNTESDKSGWNMFIADEGTMKRLRGHLPEIEIDGENYFVDWKLKELRHTNNPHLGIGINLLEPVDDGTVYRGLYNTNTRRMAEPLRGNEKPDDLAFLHIPYELKLDPVAVAREYGLKDTKLLPRFPVEQRLKADIVPLDKSQKQHLEKYMEQIRQSEQQNNRQRKGKGL